MYYYVCKIFSDNHFYMVCVIIEGIKVALSERSSLVITVGQCAKTWWPRILRCTWECKAQSPLHWQARLPSHSWSEGRSNCRLSYLFWESSSTVSTFKQYKVFWKFTLLHLCMHNRLQWQQTWPFKNNGEHVWNRDDDSAWLQVVIVQLNYAVCYLHFILCLHA